MFGINQLKISLSFNPFLFVAAVFLLIAFTIFTYRYTVPQIAKGKKLLLIIARSLGLGLLLLAIFEPTLTIVKKNILNPVTLFFVDNSRSMQADDKIKKGEVTLALVNKLNQSPLAGSTQLKLFGSGIKNFSLDSLNQITFADGSTNFSDIFNFVTESKDNISSIVIVSDGVITDGEGSIYEAERSGIPVFTIGIGDTVRQKDIEIKSVLYNEFIYAETPTTITSTIINDGFANKNAILSIYENDVLIGEQSIILSSDGVQNVQLNYLPKSSGENKLTFAISNLEGESTYANNKKVFFINVLSNKVKVAIVSGSASSDLSFIKNALLVDNNLAVNSITQTGVNKYLEKNNREKILDSADVIILVGFPSKETSPEILRRVSLLISDKNTPYLIVLSGSTDFNLLVQLKKDLPFTFGKAASNNLEVQPNIISDQQKNPLLQSRNSDPLSAWNNLPPVYQPFSEFTPKPESDVIAKLKINNVLTNKPLILSRRIGNQRSIAVLAMDIWKWKLQTAMKDQDVFERFILNSVKWLNSPEDKKKVQIKTLKKLFAIGEEVEFTAQVYDDAFNPISDAEVKVRAKNGSDNFELNLNSLGNGLYEGVLQSNKPGNYSFNGEAKQNNKTIGTDKGLFNIGEVDVEMLNTKMDYDYLNSLANVSAGKFYSANDASTLFNRLIELNNKSSKEKIDIKEHPLWSNEFLMIAIILLFAAEWFIRKREGML